MYTTSSLTNVVTFHRVLIEANCPYRVVHANAAFSQFVIGTSTSIHGWMERQNSLRKSKNQVLEKTLREMIPDTNIHLTIYPVLGSEKVSHYLIETADLRQKKRRHGKLEEHSRAIG